MKCELLVVIAGNETCSATLNHCNNDPRICNHLKRDKNGLRNACEKIECVDGELLCEGVDFCSYVEAMKNGNYYDCIFME